MLINIAYAHIYPIIFLLVLAETYNQVAQLKEPEVAAILRRIWEAHEQLPQ